MFKYEIMMMMMVGSLPGVGVYYLGRWYLTGSLVEDSSEGDATSWTPEDSDPLDESGGSGYASPWRYSQHTRP